MAGVDDYVACKTMHEFRFSTAIARLATVSFCTCVTSLYVSLIMMLVLAFLGRVSDCLPALLKDSLIQNAQHAYSCIRAPRKYTR